MVRSLLSSLLLFSKQFSTKTAVEGQTFFDFPINGANGQSLDLTQFKDKVIVAVNVATKCGYTQNNYAQLSTLLTKYYDQGLRVLLFPCNQFGNQEPGDACNIAEAATAKNPLFITTEKVKVNGADTHPLWKWLKSQAGGFLVDTVKWNFTKFLIDRQGKPYSRRFSSNEEPNIMEPFIQELLGQGKQN